MKKEIKYITSKSKIYSPLEFAFEMGDVFSKFKNVDSKKKIGQFFTPKEIAVFIANYVSPDNINKEIKILDPGAGMGILTCAIVEKIIKDTSSIKQINLSLYELDKTILPYLKMVLNNLKEWAISKKVNLKYIIINKDYVLDNLSAFTKKTSPKFDIIVSNPPYFKISKKDKDLIKESEILYQQPNIYSIFISVSIKLLKNDGDIIFITPRSFTSGNYFKKFREFLFEHLTLINIHVFETRNKTFQKDNVLQEIILFKGVKRKKNKDIEINISRSKGVSDINNFRSVKCNESKMINLSTIDKSLFIPISVEDISLLETFTKWNNNLKKLNLKASTGPVVYFRNLKYLRKNKIKNYIPFIWLNNVNDMSLDWPNKKLGKSQYFKSTNNSHSVLVDNKNYVLVRRFSAKGDKKRLISCPLYKDNTIFSAPKIAIENKLNYIYKINSDDLTKNEVVGISALLSSSFYNRYFSILSGNTNVSVTELNQITFPKLVIISKIGAKLIKSGFSESNIEKEVGKLFKL